jgi:hypothetical protein
MPKKTISEYIQGKQDEYSKTQIKANPSFAPHQKDILELIDYYWMNRYRDGDTDSTGFKKAFFNVITPPSEVASKMIDLDTKDIRIKAVEGQSYYPAWLFGKDLKVWMKDKKNNYGKTFGQFLNEIVYKYPKYGHLIAKKAKDTVHLVNLQNLSNKEDGGFILESDLIVEEHQYTPYQIRRQGWDKKKVEKAIEKYEKDGVIKVLEAHGDCGSDKYNYFILPKDADNDEIIFYDNKEREDLYKELKFDDIPGRAMGRGMPERLFEAQIAKNQQENWLRSGQRWSSKHIFQTRDDTMAKNLITQIENGDVLTVLSEITAVPVEERNLPAYNWLDNKWDKHIQEMSFAYNQVRGERPPSGTPLGTSILQTNMAVQYYDLKREELGMFIKDILYDWIIPSFKSQKNKRHELMLGEFEEDELDKMRNLILTNKANQAILRYIAKNMRLPSARDAEVLKAIEKEKLLKSRGIQIPDKFYENLKYKIDIIITNEQIDVASRLTTLQTVLQIIGSNPTILKDPRTKKVFYKLLDLAGFSPVDFGIDEPENLENILQGRGAELGGSIARVSPARQPQQITTPTTL